jgi:hypothetical protein
MQAASSYETIAPTYQNTRGHIRIDMFISTFITIASSAIVYRVSASAVNKCSGQITRILLLLCLQGPFIDSYPEPDDSTLHILIVPP